MKHAWKHEERPSTLMILDLTPPVQATWAVIKQRLMT